MCSVIAQTSTEICQGKIRTWLFLFIVSSFVWDLWGEFLRIWSCVSLLFVYTADSKQEVARFDAICGPPIHFQCGLHYLQCVFLILCVMRICSHMLSNLFSKFVSLFFLLACFLNFAVCLSLLSHHTTENWICCITEPEPHAENTFRPYVDAEFSPFSLLIAQSVMCK